MSTIVVWLKNADLLTEKGRFVVLKHAVWAKEIHTLWNIRQRLIEEIESKKTVPSLRGKHVVHTHLAKQYYYRSLLLNAKSTSAANDWFTCYKYGLAECLDMELPLGDDTIFKATDVYFKTAFTVENGFVLFPLKKDEYRLSEGSDAWTDDDTKLFRDYSSRVVKFMSECDKHFSEEIEVPFACRRWRAKIMKIHKELYGDD